MENRDELREQIIRGLAALNSTMEEMNSLMGKAYKQLASQERSATACDLSLSEIHFLTEIASPDPINGTTLAKRLGLTRGGISKMASRLLSRGMIKAEKSEENKKVQYYTLSDSGKLTFRIHNVLHEIAANEFLNSLEKYRAQDIKIFIEILLHVSSSLSIIAKNLSSNAIKYLSYNNIKIDI
jgi:DNA-binding MarR family transcriptional regulator